MVLYFLNFFFLLIVYGINAPQDVANLDLRVKGYRLSF